MIQGIAPQPRNPDMKDGYTYDPQERERVWKQCERLDRAMRVARAAEALIESLTNGTYYASGKWQAGGKDYSLQLLAEAVSEWSSHEPDSLAITPVGV